MSWWRPRTADPDPVDAQPVPGRLELPVQGSPVRQRPPRLKRSELILAYRDAPAVTQRGNPMAVGLAIVTEVCATVSRGGQWPDPERARLVGVCMRCCYAIHPAGHAPEPEHMLISAVSDWAMYFRDQGVMTERRLYAVLGLVSHTARQSMIERDTTLVRGQKNIAFADAVLKLGGALLLYSPLLEAGVQASELAQMIDDERR